MSGGISLIVDIFPSRRRPSFILLSSGASEVRITVGLISKNFFFLDWAIIILFFHVGKEVSGGRRISVSFKSALSYT